MTRTIMAEAAEPDRAERIAAVRAARLDELKAAYVVARNRRRRCRRNAQRETRQIMTDRLCLELGA